MVNPFRAIKNGLKLRKHFKGRIFFDYMSKLAQLQHTPKIIETKEGYKFEVTTASDYLLIREMMDDMYGKIEKGWTVVDVGAHKGTFTIRAATNAKMVYSFEPSQESFMILDRNLDLNRIDNVHADMVALGGKHGEMDLKLSKSALSNSLYSGIGEETGEVQRVMVITLDEALQEIEKVDFLKMDCEKAEFDIIYSAYDSTIDKIQRFMIELHGDDTENKKLTEFLAAKGFKIRSIKIGGYIHIFGERKWLNEN